MQVFKVGKIFILENKALKQFQCGKKLEFGKFKNQKKEIGTILKQVIIEGRKNKFLWKKNFKTQKKILGLKEI